METIIEAVGEFLNNPAIVLVGTVTLIQIAPIKINPWTALFKWIGKIINGDIQKELSELKADFEVTKANNMRWDILNFANSCRNHQRHTKEEWYHVMSQIKEYESYTEEKGIDNGVIEEDSRFLRELYREISIKNDFLL